MNFFSFRSPFFSHSDHFVKQAPTIPFRRHSWLAEGGAGRTRCFRAAHTRLGCASAHPRSAAGVTQLTLIAMVTKGKASTAANESVGCAQHDPQPRAQTECYEQINLNDESKHTYGARRSLDTRAWLTNACTSEYSTPVRSRARAASIARGCSLHQLSMWSGMRMRESLGYGTVQNADIHCSTLKNTFIHHTNLPSTKCI
jgi:hypothetical protein